MSEVRRIIVDGAPLSERQKEEATTMARDLVIPPTGSPSDRFVPFTSWEKEKAQAIYHRLSARPDGPREEIRNLASLVDMAGHTSGGLAMGLLAEFRDMARRHPQEFIEETGGDLARNTWESLAETLEPRSQTAQEGLLCKMHQLRAELAGPKPSGVEWHLADAAVLSWADYHRCVIERDQLSDRNGIKLLTYHDQRVDRAHKRFLRTLKTLAAVRKLDLTAVQININGAINPNADE
jgi:hypothetical protein